MPSSPNALNPIGVPLYNADQRELWFQGQLVKRFQQPADNQETVLAAFEEDGWPPRIDDPLPQDPDVDTRERLHDTIKNLNLHQVNPLVSFHGDGSGEGVRWPIRGGGQLPQSFPSRRKKRS
ncbi:MAG: hypothetical protein U0746_03805 [Gemmataceae bacterium]